MNSLFTDRKGQQKFNIASIGSIAIALLVVAVIIGLNSTILEKIKKTSDDNSATIGTNESLTWAGNNTGINLGQDTAVSFILYNNGTLVNRGAGDNANYTTTSNTITIINTSAGTAAEAGPGGPKGKNSSDWQTDKLNLTYTYLIGSSARNVTGFGIDGQSQIVGFVPTIAIVAIAAILIGIIFTMFGRRVLEK